MVDELAFMYSVHTNAINHDPACTFVMTGSKVPGKPSMGSWVSYGLGSVAQDLPGFVVLNGGLIPPGGLDCSSSRS